MDNSEIIETIIPHRMAETSSFMDSDVDCDHIEYMVDVIKPFLLHHVKSTHLLPYMPLVVKENASKIRKLETDGEIVKAAELLLECLQQDKTVPGRYAAFRDALREAGYDHVCSVFDGGNMEDNYPERCELLKIFANPIVQKVDPSLLIQHLRPHDLLTPSDESEIRNCQTRHSREHAVFMLLDMVHRRKLGWYGHLMSAMYELYPEIVELVDPHLKEKKDDQMRFSQTESMDTDKVMENTLSVIGSAYHSEKLMAGHESKAEKHGHGSGTSDKVVPIKQRKLESQSDVDANRDVDSSSSVCIAQLGGDENGLKTSEESVHSACTRSLSSTDTPCREPVAPVSTASASRATPDLSDEQQKELYKKIKTKFVETVDANQLVIYLDLGHSDDEKVSEKHDKCGRQAGAVYLLQVLLKRVPNWVDDLCHGLRNKHLALSHLADFIDKTRQTILQDAKSQTVQLSSSSCKPCSDPVTPTFQKDSALSNATTSEYDSDSGNDDPAGIEDQQNSNTQNDLSDSTSSVHQTEGNLTAEEESTSNVHRTKGNLTVEGSTSDVHWTKRNLTVEESTSDVHRTKGNLTAEESTSHVHQTEGHITAEESTDTPEKELSLRLYQEELAQDALNGVNTIICAPTGSGKTFVAVKIMQEHLKKKGVRKIVFFANQVALVEQQFKVIKEHMPKDSNISKVSGDNPETMKMPLPELIAKSDILLMTPQILEDALKDGDVSSLSAFTMLVFDECHHTKSNHVFNQIMFRYMNIKLDESIPEDKKCLPQIVGLTASVGVGKSRDMRGAVEHIKNLCANLDASGGVATVEENRADLANHTGNTGTDFQKTEGRKEDIFKNVVSEKLMKTIEDLMRKSNYVGTLKTDDILKPPSDKAEHQYMSWLSNLFREVAKIEDPKARRFFIAHRSHLEIYHRSLSINADCQTKDALKRLDEELGNLHPSAAVMDDTDNKLMKLYEEFKPLLKSASQNPLCINPKLTALRATILEPFKEEKDCRVMVFVKTRDLALALLDWMKDDKQLADLNPGIFVGQGVSSNKGGMTRHEQLQSAEHFRKGDHKVIIATSVAEEGMDFSKCNLVIQYEYVTNEIAMVQARGRARADNSSFVVVTDKHKRIADKEELNMSREMMMYRALNQLQDKVKDDPERFRKDIIEIQQIAKAERDNEAARGGNRVLKDGDFALRCLKCDVLACFSTDIRRIEKVHHAVLPEDFHPKIKVKPHPKAPVNLKDLKISSKINCEGCGHDWGVAIIYRNATFPVIKINSFVVTDSYGRRDLPKKWNRAPFPVPEMTPDDFKGYHSLEES